MQFERLSLERPCVVAKAAGLITVAILLSCCGQSAWGQLNANGNRIAGLRSSLPVIAPRDARPLEGADGSLQVAAPNASVGSFIDSISSSDAAFSVVIGQSRILTLKQGVADEDGNSVIAIGDPSVADFQQLPNPKLFRVLGLRPGVTDFSVTTAEDETISLEVHVTYDLKLLTGKLRQLFPDADLRLGQLREHLVIEGQARSNAQVSRIIETVEAYLESVQAEIDQQGQTALNQDGMFAETGDAGTDDAPPPLPPQMNAELGGISSATASIPKAKIINLLRVPGVQQVMLKVKIAELNRTAVREIGADILGVDPDTGNLVGTQIGGSTVSASGMAGLGGLLGMASSELGPSGTAFGIFPSSDWQIIFRALRQNGFVKVLAEPNLVAMSGHNANFLAGGEFPVPIPQSTGAGSNSVTVEFREFGIRLDFLPFIVDEDRIRLSVTPEVSTIDFTLGTTLVAGGDPVPGLNTRRANTTVEMQPGQTLAIAGLLQVELGGQTGRIPGLGDLPYIGPFFSNTSSRRVEKELLVLVSPYLVQPLDGHHAFPLPGDEIEDPTDHEIYFENKFEGETGVRHRSTVHYWPYTTRTLIQHERRVITGPVGFGQ